MVAIASSIRPLLQVHFGSPANATDDTLGKVVQVFVHPETWQISYLMVQRGLVMKKRLTFPIELVTEARVDSTQFSLSVDDLLQKAQAPKHDLLLLKEHLPVESGSEKLGGLSALFFDRETYRLTHLVIHRHALAGGEVLLDVGQLAVLLADRLEVKVPVKEFAMLPHYRPDSELAEAVRQSIWDYARLRIDIEAVTVLVQCNEVWLTGHVSSDTNRRLMEDQTSLVRGVRGIHNELVADTDLAMEVAAALSKHAQTRGQPIGVYPQLGEVHLRGLVPTEQVKQVAEEVALTLPGVESVHNEMAVSSKADHLPELAAVTGQEDVVPGTEPDLAKVKPSV